MSKKELLSETAIRRFMKLANIPGTFANLREASDEETVEEAKAETEETVEEATENNEDVVEEATEETEETVNESEEETLEEEEETVEEMSYYEDDPDADPAPEGGAEDVSLSDEEAALLVSLGQKIEKLQGGMGMDDEMAEPEMDDEMPEPEEEMGEDEEDMMEEEFDIDALVNEVSNKVLKRLVSEKIKNS